MIFTCIPYGPAENPKNLGAAYNKFMSQVGDDDWVCFIDHDAMFTTFEWHRQLEKIITKERIGIVTCMTNRIGNEEQLVFLKDSPGSSNHDMCFHRKIGKDLLCTLGTNVKKAHNLISGVILLTSKRVWKHVGGFKNGFFTIDNDYDMKCRTVGYETYIAEGVYVYHWYRAAKGELPPSGYKKPQLEL